MSTDAGGGTTGGITEADWEERRAHRRVTLDAEVWLGQGGIFSRTRERLRDLSLGGAFIELEGHYQIGSVFDLRIALDGRFINSTVTVRRTLPNQGAGVQFLDLSPEGREHLAAAIEQRMA